MTSESPMVDKTHSYKHDQPIERANDDKLGRATFAKNIAQAITRNTNTESYAIGIYGAWGSGKSSVINMIIEELNNIEELNKVKENEKSIILRFEPWYFSGQDQLYKQFFLTLIAQLQTWWDKFNKLDKRIADNLLDVVEVLAPFVGLVIHTNIIISLTSPLIKFLKKLLGIVDKPFDPIEAKKKVSEKLTKLNRKLVIIIDDMDRLTNDETKQIFQIVKAVADFSNTVYILSFDKDVVIKTLEEVQHGDPYQYLEKIIQVPFELPAHSPLALSDYLMDELEEIIHEEISDDLSIKKALIVSELHLYLISYREINRFLNVFRFDYALLKGEVNIHDLIWLTAIKVIESDVYYIIRKHKDLFLNTPMSVRDQFINFEREIKVSHSRRLTAVKYLEKFRKKLSTHSQDRLTNSQYFDRYFSLGVPESELSEKRNKGGIAIAR